MYLIFKKWALGENSTKVALLEKLGLRKSWEGVELKGVIPSIY